MGVPSLVTPSLLAYPSADTPYGKRAAVTSMNRLPLVLGALGWATGVALLLGSTGTNDIHTWKAIGARVRESGLFAAYQSEPHFNHPPLMGLLAWICFELSSGLDVPFSLVFDGVRAGAITAVVVFWLLCLLGRLRSRLRRR